MKFEIEYFKCFTRPDGKKGRISDTVEAQGVEHAALVFNRKYFRYFRGMSANRFKELPAHFKFWALTINGEEYGEVTLAAHREQVKKLKTQMRLLRSEIENF